MSRYTHQITWCHTPQDTHFQSPHRKPQRKNTHTQIFSLCLIKHHAIKTHGDVKISSMQSSLRQHREVKGHLHTYTALFLNNNPPVDDEWVVPRANVDAIQRENHWPCQELSTVWPARSQKLHWFTCSSIN
jgi:hypothetical protein